MGSDSCSVVISLGHYWGHIKNELSEPNKVLQKYEKQYEDLYCKYMLALDRIKAVNLKSDVISKSLQVTVKNDYTECKSLHFGLNVLRNNVAWRDMKNILSKKNLGKEYGNSPKLEDKSFSSQQLLVFNTLLSMNYFLSRTSGVKYESIISKQNFIEIFNNLCIYGISEISDVAISVLMNLSSNCLWWNEGITELFQNCYGVHENIIPRKR